jgi:hypothetical protein
MMMMIRGVAIGDSSTLYFVKEKRLKNKTLSIW